MQLGRKIIGTSTTPARPHHNAITLNLPHQFHRKVRPQAGVRTGIAEFPLVERFLPNCSSPFVDQYTSCVEHATTPLDAPMDPWGHETSDSSTYEPSRGTNDRRLE